MKKRLAGGAIILAIGLGIWLSNLFNGLGPGGDGEGFGETSQVAVNVDETQLVSERDEAPLLPPSAIPTVLIRDRDYLLLVDAEDGSTTQQPATLEQVVSLAQDATPDLDGIRIYIKREGSSRAGTEAALDTALKEAGITDASIRRHPQLVE